MGCMITLTHITPTSLDQNFFFSSHLNLHEPNANNMMYYATNAAIQPQQCTLMPYIGTCLVNWRRKCHVIGSKFKFLTPLSDLSLYLSLAVPVVMDEGVNYRNMLTDAILDGTKSSRLLVTKATEMTVDAACMSRYNHSHGPFYHLFHHLLSPFITSYHLLSPLISSLISPLITSYLLLYNLLSSLFPPLLFSCLYIYIYIYI